jgi:hypothetical protein
MKSRIMRCAGLFTMIASGNVPMANATATLRPVFIADFWPLMDSPGHDYIVRPITFTSMRATISTPEVLV